MDGRWILPCLCVGFLLPGAQLQTINIAWMANSPFIYYFNASTSLGSLAYSIQYIENNASLLPGYTFDAQYKDSQCNSKNGLGSFWDFLDNNGAYRVDLVLGPVCTGAMQPVALLTSYLNLPTFGWISSDPQVADKRVYDTLLRFLWPIDNIGAGVVLLMKEFGWDRVSIISTEGGDYDVLASSVRQSILAEKWTVNRWEQNVPEGATDEEILARLTLVKTNAKIIVVVFPESEMPLWAWCAYEADMHKGDYVFIYTNQVTPQSFDLDRMTSIDYWQKGNDNDTQVYEAMRNFFLMFAQTDASRTDQFLADFKTAGEATWPNIGSTWPAHIGLPLATPDFYSMFLFDAMKVYARFAEEVRLGGGQVTDGRALFQAAKGSVTQHGATGDIILSDSNDRIANYYIMHMSTRTEEQFDYVAATTAELVGTTLERSISFSSDAKIIWGEGSTGKDNAPPSTPACGFDGSKCPPYALYIAPAVVTLVLIILGVIIYLIYRKMKYERELADMSWKINYDEVNIYTGGIGAGSRLNLRTKSMNLRKSKGSITDSLEGGQLFITVANYKGNMAALKTVHINNKIKVDRELLQEMRNMTETKHNNLNVFMGACTDPPNVCVAWEYCTKGSLQDVIWNDNITLDDMFKFSIAIDVIKGVCFLHTSDIKVHGKLKSNNVVIDGRWACKLTDYGLTVFTSGQGPDPELSEHQKYGKLLWTAPEDLRSHTPDEYEHLRGEAPSGDVYAVGIIMKEVFCRNGPYTENEDLDPKDIIEKLVTVEEPPFRPTLCELPGSLESTREVGTGVCNLIMDCLAEDPKIRPTAPQALKTLSKVNPFKKANVMDNMIAMMEKYSNHLEAIVAERTAQLDEEKKKTEVLLYRMLPRAVADDLKMGRNVEAVSYDLVTLYFSDIPKFSEYVAGSTPFQVVDILNGIYSLMDDVIPNHDVYKVETVNDVYVIASGLPVRNGDRHVVEIANCALDLISAVIDFKIPHRPKEKMAIRIGMNTGPIVTGVVGLTSPRYCLFGDTINVASRMESTGFPMRIHMSPRAYKELSQFAGYRIAERGVITVKGKGDMCTYWLMGREGFTKKLPNYEEELSKDKHPHPPKFLPVTQGKALVEKPRPARTSVESGFSENTTSSNPASRKTSLDVPTQRGDESPNSMVRKISTDAIRKTSIVEEPEGMGEDQPAGNEKEPAEKEKIAPVTQETKEESARALKEPLLVDEVPSRKSEDSPAQQDKAMAGPGQQEMGKEKEEAGKGKEEVKKGTDERGKRKEEKEKRNREAKKVKGEAAKGKEGTGKEKKKHRSKDDKAKHKEKEPVTESEKPVVVTTVDPPERTGEEPVEGAGEDSLARGEDDTPVVRGLPPIRVTSAKGPRHKLSALDSPAAVAGGKKPALPTVDISLRD